MGFDFALIDADDLASDLDRWAAVDARPVKEWERGRIPGALSFSWESYTETDSNGVRYRTWPPERLAMALGEAGIRETTPVVVYGDADTSWGGEGWVVWVLALLGHKGPVRLLDGGIGSWRNAGYALERGNALNERRSATYTVFLDSSVGVSSSEIAQDPGRYALIDVRSLMEWSSIRLPGAVHINWERFFQGPYRRPLPSAEVKRLFEEEGIPADKSIVFYCTGGIRSGYAWAVSRLAGLKDVKNFEGGIEEWEWWKRKVSPESH